MTISPSLSTAKSASARPRSQRADLDGWDAHFLRWGDVGNPPVLLLHGFTAHAHSWQHLAQELSDSHDVVALDQRGHGHSAPTDLYGTRVLVDDVLHLFDRLGWDSGSIVGQSMGGVTGFLFAATHPSRVDKLVVIDAGPVVAPEGSQRIQANLVGQSDFASVDEALLAARQSFPGAAEILLSHRVLHNLELTPHGRLAWRTARGLLDGSARRADHSVAERWNAWRTVRAPVLLVHGLESDILTPTLVEELLAVRPETEVTHIAGAGHAIPLDQPEALALAVRTYLLSS